MHHWTNWKWQHWIDWQQVINGNHIRQYMPHMYTQIEALCNFRIGLHFSFSGYLPMGYVMLRLKNKPTSRHSQSKTSPKKSCLLSKALVWDPVIGSSCHLFHLLCVLFQPLLHVFHVLVQLFFRLWQLFPQHQAAQPVPISIFLIYHLCSICRSGCRFFSIFL